MAKQLVRVGHSPDPDDAFMFYALAHDKLDTGPYEFRHQLEDIETLNRRALEGELEVSAVSIHAYSQLTDKYALLSSGSSMGDRYGPMFITREPIKPEELSSKRVAVPGTLTTAFLAANIFNSHYSDKPFEYDVIPFDQIIDAVAGGKYDVGLIIHEGQLTYQNQGLHLLADLGAWWWEQFKLPLPLGGNVVRKDLGDQAMREISRLLKASIQYSLDHREAALEYALNYARDMTMELADKFVGMYVNDWTLDYGPVGREAISVLLNKGVEAGIIEGPIKIEFVD